MKNIYLATTSFSLFSKKPMDLLEKYGFDITENKFGRKLNEIELISEIKNCDGVIGGTENYTKRILNNLTKLKVISRLGVGMDNIDLETAQRRGIKIYKTKTTPAPAVAELVLGLIVDVARNISQSNDDLKIGQWEKQMGSLLQGKTLGIIGLGKIGKALVELVRGFNFNVLAYDLHKDGIFQKENNVTYCDLNTLLKKSHIVSIHVNLTNKTYKLINKDRLKLMKSNSILINTARGEIVDEKALYEALINRSIGGAGLDVFENEPYTGPLTKLGNVVLTPHIGAYAKEIRIKMEVEAAKNLIKGLNEK